MRRVLIGLLLWIASTGIAQAERRLALIIGNSTYVAAGRLINPRNDAQDVVIALRRLGFEVAELHDATTNVFDSAIDSFVEKSQER